MTGYSSARVFTVTRAPSASLSTSAARDRLARRNAAHHLDALAEAVADLDLRGPQAVALDHEHAVDAVAILQRVGRHGQDAFHQIGDDVDAREAPGLSRPPGFGTRPSSGNARVCGFTAGLRRAMAPVTGVPGSASTASDSDWPTLTHGGHLLGHFRRQLERIDLDQ